VHDFLGGMSREGKHEARVADAPGKLCENEAAVQLRCAVEVQELEFAIDVEHGHSSQSVVFR
jgi:hypothetical protein